MNFSDANIPIYLDLDDKDLNIHPIEPEHPFHEFSGKRPSIKKP